MKKILILQNIVIKKVFRNKKNFKNLWYYKEKYVSVPSRIIFGYLYLLKDGIYLICITHL